MRLGVAGPAFPTFLMLKPHARYGGNDKKVGGGDEGRLDNAGKEFVGFLPR